MHLPKPAAAFREVWRVLRPGGRAAFSVWDAQGAGFSLIYDAVRARGSMHIALPHGPDFFQFGSPERMQTALAELGFGEVAAYSFHQDLKVPNADRYIESILSGTVRASVVLAAQTGDAMAAVRSYIAEYLSRFQLPTGGLAGVSPTGHRLELTNTARAAPFWWQFTNSPCIAHRFDPSRLLGSRGRVWRTTSLSFA